MTQEKQIIVIKQGHGCLSIIGFLAVCFIVFLFVSCGGCAMILGNH